MHLEPPSLPYLIFAITEATLTVGAPFAPYTVGGATLPPPRPL